MRMTWSPTAGLLVVPLVTVPESLGGGRGRDQVQEQYGKARDWNSLAHQRHRFYRVVQNYSFGDETLSQIIRYCLPRQGAATRHHHDKR